MLIVLLSPLMYFNSRLNFLQQRKTAPGSNKIRTSSNTIVTNAQDKLVVSLMNCECVLPV